MLMLRKGKLSAHLNEEAVLSLVALHPFDQETWTCSSNQSQARCVNLPASMLERQDETELFGIPEMAAGIEDSLSDENKRKSHSRQGLTSGDSALRCDGRCCGGRSEGSGWRGKAAHQVSKLHRCGLGESPQLVAGQCRCLCTP